MRRGLVLLHGNKVFAVDDVCGSIPTVIVGLGEFFALAPLNVGEGGVEGRVGVIVTSEVKEPPREGATVCHANCMGTRQSDENPNLEALSREDILQR